MSSSSRPRAGASASAAQPGHVWVTGVGAAQDRIRAVAGRTDAVLDRLAHAVSELVDAPATVALLEDGELVRRASTGDGRRPLGVRVPTEGTVCGTALRTGGPVRIGDTCVTSLDAAVATCCPQGRSTLSVPLVTDRGTLGVVALTSDCPDWFDAVDENTVALVAEVAAEVLLAHLPPRVTPQVVAADVTTVDVAGTDVAGTDVAGTDVAGTHVAGTHVATVDLVVDADPAAAPVTVTLPEPEPVVALAAHDDEVMLQPAVAAPPPPGPEALVPDLTVECDPEPAAADATPGLLGLWQWDAATGLATLSDPVERLAGLPPGRPRVLGTFRALIHPEDLARVEEVVQAAAAPGGTTAFGCTFRIVLRDGVQRTVQLWGDVHRNRHGLLGAVGAAADVTDLLRRDVAPPVPGPDEAPGAVAPDVVPDGAPDGAPDGDPEEVALLRAVRQLTGCGVWSWRPDDDVLEWSPEMFRLAGLEPGEVVPTIAHWHGFVHPEDLERARRLDVGALGRSGGAGETFRVVGADGAVRHVQSWSEGLPADGPDRVVRGAALDVTRQVHDRARAERLAATDPVTGLGNRTVFERRVSQVLTEPGVDVALLLLDVDRFKQVNDSLGHDVGDRLLLEVARRISAVVPEGALVARMGGDEFVVLPRPGVGLLAVRRLAESITDALRMPYVLPDSGELLVCPVSVGVTTTSGRGVTPHDLLAEAELALYRAKDSGRDRYVIYDEALRARSQSRLRAERLLRSALEHGRFMLQYQPIVDFALGRVVGAEALVRIRDENGDGLLSPDLFIDVAEDTGLVVDLDRWVIGAAIDQVERWSRQVPPGQAAPWLSVNVSARSMEHPNVVRGLLDAVRQRRVASTDIKVELTERSFLAALPGGEGSLRQLLGSGIPVGIDDFGTGYSALGYLQRFDLDFMKIDRSFVEKVGEDQRADAVVTAIVDLAHAHGMFVTAEGVETPRQARRLREIGCDLAQGYHFGRPADAARVLTG